MKKIPKFKSEKEEADFWAAHNSTDYLSFRIGEGGRHFL